MKNLHSPLIITSLMLMLAGCNPGVHVSTDKGNVSLDGDSIALHADGHPDAAISQAGDLLIDGKAVPLDEAQRALLRSYHTELNAMTSDGIAIGKQGAALAGTAMREAIKGAIRGDGEQIDKKIEVEARKIEAQALLLCRRLVTVKASQDALAAQLPVFKPYATIDTSDVDDCGSSQDDSGVAGEPEGTSIAKATGGERNNNADEAGAAAKADAAGEEKAHTH